MNSKLRPGRGSRADLDGSIPVARVQSSGGSAGFSWHASLPFIGALALALIFGARDARGADLIGSPWVVATTGSPPAWAFWQRQLLDRLMPATEEFVRRYTKPDGTWIWRDEWPGMDGSDDGYEGFYNFPLYYALGGPPEVLALSHKLWDATTRQFTRYGQVYREFDGYYDWMHHGESYVNFYFFGLADPDHSKMRRRAARFAGLYLGEDPQAPNWDATLKLIRSPLNGSRGPRFVTTEVDWSTHRDDLAPYPLPYDDIPGVTSGRAWLDDQLYPKILQALNARMMRADVPLNLTASSLVLHAYALTGESKYANWITDYVDAWLARTRANQGILPDNVGPTGKVGETMQGKWWGGYYGWKWPHGLFNQVEATLIGGGNAYLISGDTRFLELPRMVLELVRQHGRFEEGRFLVPHRHGDQGWYDYRALNPSYLVHLWYLSQSPEDYARIGQMADTSGWLELRYSKGKGDFGHEGPWLRFLEGKFPQYPALMLEANYRETLRRLEMIRTDTSRPEERDVHHWQQRNPVVLEGLVQTMMGAPNHVYHGGLLHGRLRYFDPTLRRPGMPDSVAALVDRIGPDSVSVQLVNLHPTEPRDVVLQAGVFAEHAFVEVAGEGRREVLRRPWLRVSLKPGAVGRLDLTMQRYRHRPSYTLPWDVKEAP